MVGGNKIMRCCNSPTAKAVTLIVLLQFILLCVFFQLNVRSMSAAKKVRLSEVEMQSDLYAEAISSINQTSQERVRLIKKYCERNSQSILAQNPDYRRTKTRLTNWIWMISSHHKLFYCATPKCGSTTWKSYIMEDLRIDWKVDTHEAAQQLGVREFLKGNRGFSSAVDLLERYRPDNRLIIVRNPWARIVSAYQDKVKDKGWDLKHLCYGWEKYEGVKEPTFEQFVDCVLQKPTKVLWESHTHPLTSLCAVCLMDYNIVLKLEELDSAEPFLMKAMNFTLTPKYNPPRKQKYRNSYSKYYTKIPSPQIRKLQRVYKYDIELFGYPLNPLD